MIVYITRPEASEVYLGGKRHLDVWLQEPHYDHRPRFDGCHYTDAGWSATHCMPQAARLLLSQDHALLEAVMDQVVLSVYPAGMNAAQGEAWSNGQTDDGDPMWRTLYTDKEWETRCNRCHKRFLLKVDLRTNQVELVTPFVIIGRFSYTTTDITPELALQRYHDVSSEDIIPF
jgi:hypothetical protein